MKESKRYKIELTQCPADGRFMLVIIEESLKGKLLSTNNYECHTIYNSYEDLSHAFWTESSAISFAKKYIERRKYKKEMYLD